MRRYLGSNSEAALGALLVFAFLVLSVVLVLSTGCSNPAATGEPPAPVVLSVTNGPTGVLLFWTESTADDFLRYDIYRSEISGELGTFLGSNFEPEDCMRYNFGLEAGMFYAWTVVVVSEGGEAPSNVVSMIYPGDQGGGGEEE